MDDDDMFVEPEEDDPFLKSPTPLIFKTCLASDAIYFNAARRSLANARKAKSAVDRAHRVWKDEERRARLADEQDPAEGRSHLGRVLEQGEPRIAQAYGPYIEALAVTHVMAATALEAHINDQAESRLSAAAFSNFDKLPLQGKWLFLPRLVTSQPSTTHSFDPGSEPFQSFTRLVKIRNDLVHHKTKREDWKAGEAPEALLKLGLTLERAEASFATSEAMIRQLAEILGSRPPYWLAHTDYLAFDWSIEGLDLSEDC